MTPRTTEEIARMARDGDAIDQAFALAYRRTVLRHRSLGTPLAIWRDGQVVEIPADLVELPEIDDVSAKTEGK